jgi:hypothetical protein
MKTNKTKETLTENFNKFSEELREIVEKEHLVCVNIKDKESRREGLKSVAEKQVGLIYNFVKENGLKLVELNEAWCKHRKERRTFYNHKDCNSRQFPNMEDKAFVDKFNKGKQDTLFVHSTFWGINSVRIM